MLSKADTVLRDWFLETAPDEEISAVLQPAAIGELNWERAPMTNKITYEELIRRMHDPSIPDAELRPFLRLAPGTGPLDPVVVPDPDRVVVSEVEMDAASAIRIGNGLARWRRQRQFQSRRLFGENLPVLVSEGDSWFQFPFLITDVIDHLGDEYLIWSLDAAGDTARNMVELRPEYMDGLRQFDGEVRAFLFSGAGNDVIGENEEGVSSLLGILKPAISNGSADDHIDAAVLGRILAGLTGAYATMIRTIRAEPSLAFLPIIIHGYDYPFAYPHVESGAPDGRSPLYAARDEWLGAAFTARGIMDADLRRAILERLIDVLYNTLAAVAGDSRQTGVYVVDCRNVLASVMDWADEIHGTDEGFARVAARFRETLAVALSRNVV